MKRSTVSIRFVLITVAVLLLMPGGASWADAAPHDIHMLDTTPTPEPTIPPPPRPVRVRFSGNIESLPPDLLGEWVIGGVNVTVTADTVLEPSNSAPKVGDWASVKATCLYDGSLVANKILYQDASQIEAHPVEFKGLIQAVEESSLTVGGILVQTDAQTNMIGIPIAGFLAQVKGFLQLDSSVLALQITVLNPSEVGTEFEGVIEEFPPSPYVGHWRIGGIVVLATAGVTEFPGTDPQLGLFAEVSGILSADGLVHAKTIRVLDPTANSVEGIVQLIGENEWVIGDTVVGVDENTLIDESRARAATGVQAEATLKDQGDGTLLAIRIRLERPW